MTIPLAQSALHLIDTNGVDDARRFINAHLAEGPQPALSTDDANIYLLSDGSVAHQYRDTLTFLWHNLPSDSIQTTCRTNLPLSPIPLPHRDPAPLCHWPNETDLQQAFFDRLHNEACHRLSLSLDHPPVLTGPTVHLLARDLAACVKDIITSFEMPDSLLEALDQALQLQVDTLEDQLPAPQHQALLDYAVHRLAA